MAYKQSKNPFGKSPLNFSSPLNSFDSLVGKLMNQGKSKEAATKIAGKVANAKMKGAGSGPTAAQKARAKGSAAKMADESPLDKELVGKQHNLPEHLKAKIEAAPESPAKMKSPIKAHDKKLKALEKRIKRVRQSKEGSEGQGGIDYELLSQLEEQKKKLIEDHAKQAKEAKDSPAKNKASGKEHAQMGRKQRIDHLMVEHPAKPGGTPSSFPPKRKKKQSVGEKKFIKEEGKATKVIKDRKKTADLLNAKNPPKSKKDDSPAKISAKRAERKAKKGKGFISQRMGGKDTERRFSKLTRKGKKEMKETGMVSGRNIKKGKKIKESPANLKGIVGKAEKVAKIAKRVKPQQIARQAKLAALSGEAAIKGAIAGAAGYLAGKAGIGGDKRAKTGPIQPKGGGLKKPKKKSPLNNAYENPEYFVPTKSSYGQDMDNFFNTVSSAYEDRKRYGKGLKGMKGDPFADMTKDEAKDFFIKKYG